MLMRLYLENDRYFSLDVMMVCLICVIVFSLPVGLYLAGRTILSTSQTQVATDLSVILLALLFIYDAFLSPFINSLNGSRQIVSHLWQYSLDLIPFAATLFIYTLRSKITQPLLRLCCYSLIGFAFLQTAITSASSINNRNHTITSQSITLSPKANIVHVLFDTLQSTHFEKALSEVEAAHAFTGFTWFRNNTIDTTTYQVVTAGSFLRAFL